MSSREVFSTSENPQDWTGSTRMIDVDHKRVQKTAAEITAGTGSDVDKALAIFRFVRDDVKFGFTRGFWDNKASDVLASRTGYCNTKSTLFVALLRAAGIPARQVFVDIHVDVLSGIIQPGTPYLDHSYVEVYLNDTWVPTDAYIVDASLFAPAIARVQKESRLLGYGVHAAGQMEWDGRSPAFSQFNLLDDRPISTRTWGVYADVVDFYQRAETPWNRLNPLLRGGFGAFAGAANRRADAIRSS